jgi:hypothetical protein
MSAAHIAALRQLHIEAPAPVQQQQQQHHHHRLQQPPVAVQQPRPLHLHPSMQAHHRDYKAPIIPLQLFIPASARVIPPVVVERQHFPVMLHDHLHAQAQAQRQQRAYAFAAQQMQQQRRFAEDYQSPYNRS